VRMQLDSRDWCICSQRMHITLDDTLKFVLGNFKIVGCLRVQPEPCACIEVTAETKGGIRRDATPFVDDFCDARHRHMKV